MQPKNKLLGKQLQKWSLDPGTLPDDIKKWQSFLEHVAAAYKDAEEDRYSLERSLHISSDEMRLNYERIKSLNNELSGRNRVLNGLINDQAISEIMIEILKYVEAQSSNLRATICMLDKSAGFTHALTASLPKDFLGDLAPFCAGSPYLTVLNLKKAQFVEDIQLSGCSSQFKSLFQKLAIKASWSYPIFDHKDQLRAIVSVYSVAPGLPSKEISEFVLLQIAAMRMAYKLDEVREYTARDRLRMINSARLASLGEMAAGMAHEINNPLAVISGHASNLLYLMDQKELDKVQVAESCRATERSVERISKIISSLRYFSKDTSTDEQELIDVNEIMSNALELCRAQFGKSGIELSSRPPTEECHISCNGAKLSQALFHLIQNAHEAIKDLPQKWVRVEAKAIGDLDLVIISVVDSGSNVPQELQDKIFEPFFTTKAVGEGQGLGLSVCRGITESYDGKVTLDSSRSNTTFTMILPTIKKVGASITNHDQRKVA